MDLRHGLRWLRGRRFRKRELDLAADGHVRGVFAWLYRRLFLSGLPRVRGYASLMFFRGIYRGFSIGTGSRCWGGVLVAMETGSSITIGDRFSSTSDVRRAGIAVYSPCKLRTMRGAEITIGDDVALNGTSVTCRRRIEIGSGTMVAANVVIVDSDFHRHWPPSSRRVYSEDEGDRPVFIGDNVWIGMGSLILKGSRIGNNTIIGAGSVVTGAIPANVIAAGVPATVLRDLGS